MSVKVFETIKCHKCEGLKKANKLLLRSQKCEMVIRSFINNNVKEVAICEIRERLAGTKNSIRMSLDVEYCPYCGEKLTDK